MRYRIYVQGAYEAGKTEHPQKVILELAPDAHDFEPAPIGDCWLFTAARIDPLPPYVEVAE